MRKIITNLWFNEVKFEIAQTIDSLKHNIMERVPIGYSSSIDPKFKWIQSGKSISHDFVRDSSGFCSCRYIGLSRYAELINVSRARPFQVEVISPEDTWLGLNIKVHESRFPTSRLVALAIAERTSISPHRVAGWMNYQNFRNTYRMRAPLPFLEWPK